jgi:uncharacterized protein YdaU (DUF1376 family)
MGGRGVNAYLFLLCEAWLQTPQGTLPNDEDLLIEMARVSQKEWRELWPVICHKFQTNGDGRLHNVELKAEAKGISQRRYAGASGWTPERRKAQGKRIKSARKGGK